MYSREYDTGFKRPATRLARSAIAIRVDSLGRGSPDYGGSAADGGASGVSLASLRRVTGKQILGVIEMDRR